MADVAPEGLDEMDDFADEFERLGRVAGAELRAMPSSDGAATVTRSASRRRAVATASKVGVALALLAGTGWVARGNYQQSIPNDTAPAPVDPGWIVYEAGAGGRELLFLVRPDGSDPHPLVPNLDGGFQSKPDWSPNGEQIVFTMPTQGGESLWTVGVGGSNPRVLLECSDACVYLDDPSWSPDGAHVVYARMRDEDGATVGSLERVNVATGAVDVLLEGEDHDFFAAPRWSPDGRSLVVEVVHRDDATLQAEVTGTTLSVVDLGSNTAIMQPLPGASPDAVTPDWGPTGDLIVYAAPPSATSTDNELFTIAPTGGTPSRLTFLTADGGNAAFPSFDNTGQRIVFSATTPSNASVLAHIDVNGDNLTTTIGEATISGIHPRP